MFPVSTLGSNVQPLTENGRIFFDYLASKVNEVVIKIISIISNAHMKRSEFLERHVRPAEKNIAESQLDKRLKRFLNHLTDSLESIDVEIANQVQVFVDFLNIPTPPCNFVIVRS